MKAPEHYRPTVRPKNVIYINSYATNDRAETSGFIANLFDKLDLRVEQNNNNNFDNRAFQQHVNNKHI